MHANGHVVIAQRFQGGNLLTLRRNLAAQHHVEQETRYRQKNAGQHRAQHPLLLDFGIDNQVRHLLVAPMRADAAIGGEQAVQRVNHRAFGGARCQPHRHLVERAGHVVRRCQRPAVQPKNAEAALVGRTRHAGKDVLR